MTEEPAQPIGEESPSPQAADPVKEPKRPKAEKPSTEPTEAREPKTDAAATLLGQFLEGVAKLVNPVKESAEKVSSRPSSAITGESRKQQEPEREAKTKRPSTLPAKAPTTAFELAELQKAAEKSTQPDTTAEAKPSEPELIPFENIPLPIDRKLFNVIPANEFWPDDLALLTFGEGMNWTLRHAFEGVLILGATGSGKTSGSGATMAESFLHAGFGGLILTVKTGEAEHWRKLCSRCGRATDFIAVRQGGDWRLNLLAYEAQRPGQGGGMAKNLVAFCRNLLSVSSRSQGQATNEQFWQTATEQLLNATFDLFLLAGGVITFDRLANFVAAAPTDKLPSSEEGWNKIPTFGAVLAKAKQNVATAEDMRVLRRTTDYWFKIYPGLASETRTSITLGVFALLDMFRGRDIPDIISSDTNLTPESIMSGKIVVLDLPVKEFGQTGLLVQSAWKYLFQMAVERLAKAGDVRHRPVFLWEDEGQYFFSDHDHHFQDTARSARVCRVILTQNLHNFYKEMGKDGVAAANSIFGNLNTKIFHANNDPLTNEWAAKQFGSEIHTRLTISQNPQSAKGFFDSFRQMINPISNTGFSRAERWEPAVRPEEFNRLRNGGEQNDFEVDCYITWPGLADDQGRHFIQTTFLQNTNS